MIVLENTAFANGDLELSFMSVDSQTDKTD